MDTNFESVTHIEVAHLDKAFVNAKVFITKIIDTLRKVQEEKSKVST